MRYRLYQPEDFPALYLLEEQCFAPRERFPRHLMRQLVAKKDAATWMADASEEDPKEKLAGFAIVEWSRAAEERVAYLHTLEVGARFRRQGVGAALLRHCIASARAVDVGSFWLHVAVDNAAARALYQSQGFVARQREEHYYGRGRHALTCALALRNVS